MRAMTTIARCAATAVLFFACAGGSTAPNASSSTSGPENGVDEEASPNLGDKTALLVIAPSDFQDKELAGTRAELDGAQVKMSLASTVTGEVTGMSGAKANPTLTIAQADGSAYDAVVFIGGSGTTALLDDQDAFNLARKTLEAGKLLAAICMAPEILANAGLLQGKKATCWEGGLENLAAKGATVVKEPVVVDGNIITGNGPDAASDFGKAIVEYLTNH